MDPKEQKKVLLLRFAPPNFHPHFAPSDFKLFPLFHLLTNFCSSHSQKVKTHRPFKEYHRELEILLQDTEKFRFPLHACRDIASRLVQARALHPELEETFATGLKASYNAEKRTAGQGKRFHGNSTLTSDQEELVVGILLGLDARGYSYTKMDCIEMVRSIFPELKRNPGKKWYFSAPLASSHLMRRFRGFKNRHPELRMSRGKITAASRVSPDTLRNTKQFLDNYGQRLDSTLPTSASSLTLRMVIPSPSGLQC